MTRNHTVLYSSPQAPGRRPRWKIKSKSKTLNPAPSGSAACSCSCFVIAFGLAQMLLNALAIVQFVWLLVKREPNQPVAGFGMSLSKWLADVAQFLTCATDERPFPWRPWPQAS